ncbi:YfiR family protein [Pseudomaricurvus alkylphenolicus]|uniref:YfiR family protein n=1 Tax=Pseudomaricurvus alkylphenolicus TaxID=1306991 RepID=UPI001422B465|nr:YfiR family protein [Pseudomaricurvus alkylphenolicus]NIB43032.1 YfiR family protein [Pseudomaricurvus alkylphenolicus]
MPLSFSRASFYCSPLVLLALLMWPAIGAANDLSRINALKIAYVYNFTKFISWKNPRAETFNICLLSQNRAMRAGFLALARKSVQEIPVNILNVDPSAHVDSCQVLFVGDRTADLSGLDTTGALVITDQDHIDAQIHFKIISNKLRFNIHRAEMEAKGLGISSKLLRLAYEVY